MIVTVASRTFTPDIKYQGTLPTLRVYYTKNFLAADGVTPVVKGDGRQGFYDSYACSVNAGGELVVPALTLQSTSDCSEPTAKFWGQLFDQSEAPREILFGGQSGWSVPAAYGSSVTYGQLELYNRALRLVNPPVSFYTREMVIAQILGLAVPLTSLLVPREVGSALLVNGTVTVTSTYVTANAPILLTPQDDLTTGNVRVSTRVNGDSFVIVSDNVGDEGVVAWAIYAAS